MSRRAAEGYGIPSGQAPLFQDTSGVPSQPPPPMMAPGAAATAQMIANNPMFSAAAQQYGQDLASRGQAMIDSNVNHFLATSHVKTYFTVDTNYVLKKLSLLLFPYSHGDWSIQYQSQQDPVPMPPRQSVNTPDLYIPVMGFVTYVLLTGLVMGTQQRFSPEQLGITASSLLAWILAEVLIIWLCLYLLAVHSQLRWLDLIAFCGYKYVGMIASVGCGLLGGAYVYYGVLGYTALSIAYFLVRSLRLSVQPHVTEGASKLRNYFLLLIAILQPFMMLWLTSGLVGYQPVTNTS